MPNIKSTFPLVLALLMLLAMIVVDLSISTEVQAGPLASLNLQSPSQPSPLDDQSPDDDDDDDDGGEDDDDDGGGDEDDDHDDDDDGGGDDDDGEGEEDNDGSDDDDDDGDGGEDEGDGADEGSDDDNTGGEDAEDDDGGARDDDGNGKDEGSEDTSQPPSQPSPPANEPSDDKEESGPTDYVTVMIDRCELTCSTSLKAQTIELLAQVQLVHKGSGFIVEGVISNLKGTRFSVPYPGKWAVFLIAQPQIVSAEPVDDPELQAATAASFNDTPILMGRVESNTSTAQLVKCPLICAQSGPASDRGVQPVFYDGNPQGGSPNSNCGFFDPSYQELRLNDLDLVGSGNYSDGFLSLDIVVSLSNTDGPSFDWSIAADSLVDALPGIFVKGGSNGNWYDYSSFTDVPAGGATFDGSLHAPVNATNGKFFGLSHVSFCYQIMPAGGNDGGFDDGNNDVNGGGDDVHRDTAGDAYGSTVQVPLDSVADGVTADNQPRLLPVTGSEQSRDYSLIAALIIGGLTLAAAGLWIWPQQSSHLW